MLQFRHCSVDLDERSIIGPSGETGVLTQLEAALLDHLASLGGATASREELLAEVWGYDPKVVSRAVDTTVKRLRAKIEADPKQPDHLITEWGTGYKLIAIAPGEQIPPPIGDVVLGCAVVPESRALGRDLGAAWPLVLQTFQEIARTELPPSGGYLVREDIDEILVAFSSCRQALSWALAVQEGAHRERWPDALLAHGLGAPVEIGGQTVFAGLRVAIALVQGGARALTHAQTGRTEYAGRGVREVRALAAQTAGGVIRADQTLVRDAGQSVHAIPVAGGAWCDAYPPSLAGRARARRSASGRAPVELHGRDAEIEQLGAAIRRHRLVTLLGPGGIGKTTLALEIFEHLGRPGWVCAAEHARTAHAFVAAVADALEVELRVPDLKAATERVQLALADRGGELLLVLDNLEQLPPEVSGIIGAWLERTPRLGVVATSRRPLGLDGEHRFEIGPLSQAAAQELMVARIEAARGSEACTPEERVDIAEIVIGLERIPLAIELAAARVRMLGVAGIRQRLDRSLPMLSGGSSPSSRHQSMTNAIAWSWDLLEPWERAALAQLSAFSGAFGADAAEAVVDLSPWPDAPWTLDVLDGLQRHSLLHATGTAADPRLHLLAPIHQFASEQLQRMAPHALAAVADRHLDWFSQRGLPAFIDGLDGPDERTRRLQLTAEHADLHQAAEYGLEGGASVATARCWLALAHYHDRFAPGEPALRLGERLQIAELPAALQAAVALGRGRLVRQTEGAAASQSAFAQAKQLAEDCGDIRVQGRAATWGALVGFECGATNEALIPLLSEAVACGERAGDAATVAEARMLQGVSSSMHGDSVAAVEFLEGSLSVARRLGATGLRGRVLTNLGSALHATGRLDEAKRTYDAALTLHRAAGNHRSTGCLHINRGNLAVARGLLEEALIEFGQALGILRSNANQMEEGIALLNLAQVHLVRGEPSVAERHLTRALAIHDQTRNGPSRAYTLTNLSEVRRLQGRFDEGLELAREALALHSETGQVPAIAATLVQLAEIHRSSGDREALRCRAREVLEHTDGLDTPQLQGRAWVLLAEDCSADARDEAREMALRAHRLLAQANDVEGMGITAALLGTLCADGCWAEQARAAAEQLGVEPTSRLGQALTRAQTEF